MTAPVLLPFAPDWSAGIIERLAWSTDVLQAYRGQEQRRALRLGPRQTVEYSFLLDGDDRRHAEALLWRYGGGEMGVPLWFDALTLSASLASGAVSVPLDPVYRQFRVGEWVLLIGEDARAGELIEIASVAGSIGLAAATTATWPAGTRVVPVRAGNIADAASLSRFTGSAATTRLRFEMADPADWTANAGATTYRDHPVLETMPDWSEEPAWIAERKLSTLDGGTGKVSIEDLAQMPLLQKRARWALLSRAAIDAHRQRLYALCGRQGALWVPSWGQDLVLTENIGSIDTTIDVRWAGITAILGDDPARKDIRIELANGTVFYRRITGSSELSSAVERLTINAALGSAVTAVAVAAISWLSLCRQSADSAEFAWWTGDVADTVCTFMGFNHEL